MIIHSEHYVKEAGKLSVVVDKGHHHRASCMHVAKLLNMQEFLSSWQDSYKE